MTERLEPEEIAASIGSVGDAYDNALAKSANGLYETECVRTTIFHAGPYKTLSDVEFATVGWVEWYWQVSDNRGPARPITMKASG